MGGAARRRERRRKLAERRLRGSGEPTPDPLALVGILMASARRAGFTFEKAWQLASSTALSYMPEDSAGQWVDVLSSTEQAWADAYAQRGSTLDGLL